MKSLCLASAVLAMGSLSFAGTLHATPVNTQKEADAAVAQNNAAQSVPRSPFSTSTCSFNFAAGSANNFVRYCVTANGNITQFETPAGQEHIAVGSFGEGYGICDFTTATTVAYDDYADFGDTGNWNPAKVVSASATTVKIARTTSDGIWTLTQTIAQNAPNGSVKVTMSLKNNTAVERSAQLLRYADIDADGFLFNTFDATADSAMGYNSLLGSNTPFGVILQDISTLSFAHNGLAQSVPFGPDPCNAFSNVIFGPQVGVDGSIVMLYAFNVPAKSSETVSVSYKGM